MSAMDKIKLLYEQLEEQLGEQIEGYSLQDTKFGFFFIGYFCGKKNNLEYMPKLKELIDQIQEDKQKEKIKIQQKQQQMPSIKIQKKVWNFRKKSQQISDKSDSELSRSQNSNRIQFSKSRSRSRSQSPKQSQITQSQNTNNLKKMYQIKINPSESSSQQLIKSQKQNNLSLKQKKYANNLLKPENAYQKNRLGDLEYQQTLLIDNNTQIIEEEEEEEQEEQQQYLDEEFEFQQRKNNLIQKYKLQQQQLQQKQKIDQENEEMKKIMEDIKKKEEEEKLNQSLIQQLQEEEEKNYKEYQKQLQEKEQESNQCKICIDDLINNEDEVLPLQNCEHIFHKECLVGYIKNMIDNRKVQFNCPEEGCRKPIVISDFKDILGKEHYDKYVSYSLATFVDDNAQQATWCPTPDCKFVFLLNERKENNIFSCPCCKKEYCLNCKAEYNKGHKGMTCKEYQVTKNKDENDVKFEKFVQGSDYKQCPHCQFWVSRVDGCFDISCKCGHTFCYDCGGPTEGHHCPACEQY